MKILVACESSGVVRDAFIARGHEALSCDLLPTERPGPHHQGDVLPLLEKEWDLMIAHPPCTFLSVSGVHWNTHVPGRKEKIPPVERSRMTEDALQFVRALMAAPIPQIAVENPISIISSRIRKPEQIVQPWMFGHRESKATCFWLKGLQPLVATKVVEPEQWRCCGIGFPFALGNRGCPNCNGEKLARPLWDNQTPSGQNKLGPSEDRWKERSRTYQGIADAIADQWGSP